MSVNFYFWLIVIVLLAQFFLEQGAQFFHIRYSYLPIPKDIKKEFNNYDESTYMKSLSYHRTRAKFSMVSAFLSLSVLFLFWFAHGFGWLDTFVRSLPIEVTSKVTSEILRGLLYLSLLFAIRFVLSLPLKIYSTFVIEEKFGFNKTKWKTFVSDRLKGIFLSALIGLPVLATILWFFIVAGSFAWIYAWLFLLAWGIFMQYISPTFLMPLFNKFTPMADGSLKQKINRYAKKNQFMVKDIYVMDGSRRSSKSNAFFTGLGKNKRIALFDTLIEHHSDDELLAVVAHEVGHYKKKHVIKNMIFSAVQSGILFFLLSIFLQQENLFKAFYTNQVSVYAGLLFFSFLYSPLEFLFSVINNIFSRRFEFEADHYASESTRTPENLINALKNLSKDSLSNLNPHPFYVFLNYSHPPLFERISALRS